MSLARKNLGQTGEDLALAYLQKKGYQLLGRNLKVFFGKKQRGGRGAAGGEIDLLMRDKKTLVIIEVKTKSNAFFGAPQEEVDFFKKRRLIRLAKMLWQQNPGYQIRIDVVAVDERLDKIDHIISAVEE